MNFINFFNNIVLKLISQHQYCVLCGLQSSNQQICHPCNISLQNQKIDSRCWKCLATKSPNELGCLNCHENKFNFDKIFAAFDYTFPLEHILHSFKYFGKIEYSSILAQLFWSRISGQIQKLPDIIIPVPLHINKLKTRGFNQSYELLNEFKQLNQQISIIQAYRTKETMPQAHLSRHERMINIKDSFKINHILYNKHVVIVDDVVTTGYTVSELSRLCKELGAYKVEVWCLMRAK